MPLREAAGPLFKSLVFLLAVPCTILLWYPLWLVRRQELRPRSVDDPVFWIATALISIGGFVLLSCFWDFAVRGKGTPAPLDPPRLLVTNRFYLHVRNPMYVAVLTAAAGELLLFEPFPTPLLWLSLCFLAAAMIFVQVYEEPTLRQLFGKEYEDYSRAVPRWIPRLRAARLNGSGRPAPARTTAPRR
jgi:protein-S-isoprenylcysteine O-methyltransferase Ste14